MGDLRVCLPRPNGAVLREDHLYSSRLSSPPPLPASNPDPASIAEECWVLGEQTTREIVCKIQPTLVADKKRKEVIAYIQGLIREFLGCEVFPYGSVPLKTYLPDGDIDLTGLGSPNVEEAMVADVHAVLRGEECNETAQYEVKDVQSIDAEVKLVKCLVQNIVVDISFNQLGGLCTLCFLEQVDRLVGKDHLFKRSIILIKAWCYYESRILGAHHGLISTYALETLVLYIFHLFHSSLNGPLAVLYRFLDYFSKFDWDNYCISLNGPVCKSSLPDIVAEVPENWGDLLLSEDFLRNCAEMFYVPSRGFETNSRAFPQKHLNIIDPLKENNNLGRSVNRGNFYRIRSAFKYGARKLGQILLLPRERIADELNRFFANTLERHGSDYWTDVQNAGLGSGARISDQASSLSCIEICAEDQMFLKSLTIGLINGEIAGIEVPSGIRDEPEKCISKVVSSQAVPESNCPTDRKPVSGHCLTGDAKGLATSAFLAMRTTNDSSDCSPLSSDLGTLVSVNSFHAPHFYFCDLFRENGNHSQTMLATSVVDDEIRPEPKKNHLLASNSMYSCCDHEGMASIGPAVSSPVANVLENLPPGLRESDLAGISERSETLKSLLDLSGDYDSHLKSLLYGQCYHGYTPSALILPSPPMSSQLRNKNPWETVRRSLQFKRNVYPQMNTNDGVLGPQFYSVNPHLLSSVAFASEEKKQRGTGTYFPNMNYPAYKGRPPSGRGRNQASATNGQFQKHTHNNGLATASREMNVNEEGRTKLPQAEFPVLGHGKSRSSDSHKSYLSMWGSSHANGFSLPSESQLQNYSCKSGLSTTPREINKLEEGSHEISQGQYPVLGHGKSSSSDSQQSHSSVLGSSHANGLSCSSESQLQKCSCNNGLATAPWEMNLLEEGSHELSQAEYPVLGHGKSRSLDSHKSHPSVWGSSHANGLSCPSERHESGSVDPQPWGAPFPEGGNHLDSGVSHAQISAPGLVARAVQSPQPEQDSKQERVAVQSYHLKDEDDFPPLSL